MASPLICKDLQICRNFALLFPGIFPAAIKNAKSLPPHFRHQEESKESRENPNKTKENPKRPQKIARRCEWCRGTRKRVNF